MLKGEEKMKLKKKEKTEKPILKARIKVLKLVRDFPFQSCLFAGFVTGVVAGVVTGVSVNLGAGYDSLISAGAGLGAFCLANIMASASGAMSNDKISDIASNRIEKLEKKLNNTHTNEIVDEEYEEEI